MTDPDKTEYSFWRSREKYSLVKQIRSGEKIRLFTIEVATKIKDNEPIVENPDSFGTSNESPIDTIPLIIFEKMKSRRSLMGFSGF